MIEGSNHSLVNIVDGEISRTLFSSADIYAAEQKQIFARAWLYIGHESQIPSIGNFILSRMGEESVILTRDKTNRIRVHLNSCRHRGMKVCRYDEGTTNLFYCPYHAWSYGLDGSLAAVNDYKNSYKPGFDKSQWGLVQAAQVETLRGTIWATWDPDAPPLKEYMGDAYQAMDDSLRPWDGGDGETEVLGTPIKWVVPSNWKIIAENFAGDALHAPSHASVDKVGIRPANGEGRRDDPGRPVLGAYPEGHGILFGLRDISLEQAGYEDNPEARAYFKKVWAKRVENLGSRAGVWPILGTIFPNMSFHAQQPRSILVSHPISASETEMWRVFLVDKDAPVAVKRFLRKYYMLYSGPAGMTEQDDMENWNYATESARGAISSQFPFHYKAGMGQGGADLPIGGDATELFTSEQNTRMLYKRWAEYMDAPGWSGLKISRKEA